MAFNHEDNLFFMQVKKEAPGENPEPQCLFFYP